MHAKVKEKLAAVATLAVTDTDYAVKGYHLDIQVAADQVVEAVRILDEESYTIESVTGVDWLGEYQEKLQAIAKAKEDAAKAVAAAAKAAAEAAEAAKAAAEAGEDSVEAAPAPVAPPAPPAVIDETVADPEMEVVYDFSHIAAMSRVVVRCRMPRANPEVPTISDIYPGANWHERETHDFFGIKFIGHPDLSPLLLPEDADFHPLLKDYKA